MYDSSPQDRNEFEDGPCIACGAYVSDGSEIHDEGCPVVYHDIPECRDQGHGYLACSCICHN